LSEDGPSEVARAAAAFNLMQAQIKHHLAERVQILAAISHDLQTPITRMRIRTELMEAGELREKLQSDLKAMQTLVEEGITFARSAQKNTEQPCKVDLDALLDSLVYDYLDAQHLVNLNGHLGEVICTRPNALKRLIINLVDNALKFAVEVELSVQRIDNMHIEISVRDRGPGIPESELQAVLDPFYRIENSRNRGTGGTGLGLAIAQRLAHALNGEVVLQNRDGGGLEARFIFKCHI
jgi:signal transduction histidine kinase